MSGVLLVDLEQSLSDVLGHILQELGYAVVVCADTPCALDVLQDPAEIVALLSHGGDSHVWEQVLEAIPRLPSHAYVLLSTQPDRVPSRWNPHTQAPVPTVPLPFDLDELLTQMANVVAQQSEQAHLPKPD
jgi:DNA-binding NtrC family response regulator